MASLSTGNFTFGWNWYQYYHVNSINQGKKNTGISGSNLLKTLISSGNRILVWYRYFQVKPIYQYGKPVATMAYLLIHLICIIAVIKLHMHFFSDQDEFGLHPDTVRKLKTTSLLIFSNFTDPFGEEAGDEELPMMDMS